METKPESELLQLAREVFKDKLPGEAFQKAKELLFPPIHAVFEAMRAEITDPHEMMCVQSLLTLTQMWHALEQLPNAMGGAMGKMVVHTSMKNTAAIFFALTNGDEAKVERLFGLCDKYVQQLDSLAAPVLPKVKEAGAPDYSKL